MENRGPSLLPLQDWGAGSDPGNQLPSSPLDSSPRKGCPAPGLDMGQGTRGALGGACLRTVSSRQTETLADRPVCSGQSSRGGPRHLLQSHSHGGVPGARGPPPGVACAHQGQTSWPLRKSSRPSARGGSGWPGGQGHSPGNGGGCKAWYRGRGLVTASRPPASWVLTAAITAPSGQAASTLVPFPFMPNGGP